MKRLLYWKRCWIKNNLSKILIKPLRKRRLFYFFVARRVICPTVIISLSVLGFIILAYYSYEQKGNVKVIIYIALALLFQPFVKMALGRTIWNVVDVTVVLGLIGSLFVKRISKLTKSA